MLLTKGIKSYDSRAWEFDEGNRRKMEALVKRGTCEVVRSTDVQEKTSILFGKFVLAIKG